MVSMNLWLPQQQLPECPGLYWNCVHASDDTWFTYLQCVSIERWFDGSSMYRMTPIETGFVRSAPEVKTKKLYIQRDKEHTHNLQGSYFSDAIVLPEWPTRPTEPKKFLTPPAQPGLWFYGISVGMDKWQTNLKAVCIHRYATSANQTDDKIFSVDLPALYCIEATPSINACWEGPLNIQPPELLPDGRELVFPVTPRHRK